ncbi:MAG: glutamate--tRNA ligase family protein [Verrucomicrobia bacterium]|nr:glutamate--tRNA ligase family protein [Verrucomicrobiota bacterium]
MSEVRVRFAPSPTGYLHIGGARTALFNWLYARKTGGKFVLRIEDTDEARNSEAAIQVIIDSLRWLGLDWDEGPTSADPKGESRGGFGPYFQSERGDIYRKRVEELLASDKAYERDGAIRFRMQREPVIINDLVIGQVNRNLTDREELDPDFVIFRSDGKPIFHLVNVVDDIEMRITHVIRGEDHVSNTAKHIALFRAFGVEPPKFAHIPLILNANGSKMSKRDEGASLTGYMESGFIPEAVINYLSLLGWSPKDDRQLISKSELIQLFDIPQILRSNGRFDAAKLAWMNAEHIKLLPAERFRALCIEWLGKAGIKTDGYSSEYIQAALETCREKIKLMPNIRDFAAFYFTEDPVMSEDALAALGPDYKPCLSKLRDAYSQLGVFDADTLQTSLKIVAAELGVKVGLLIHPARVACTGSKIGPSLYHLMEVLGKDRVLKRFDLLLAFRLERAG